MNFKLIAESGSTKTDWALLNDTKIVKSFSSEGFNPFTQSEKYISEVIEKQVYNQIGEYNNQPLEIHFYGAGCSSIINQNLMKSCFEIFFKEAKNIFIEHDLFGACIGLSENKESIIGILGTGSNACLFDGKSIVKQRISLGYVLGDEGSGNQIGRMILKKILYEQFDSKTVQKFYDDFQITSTQIIDSLYKKPNPNRFLASFAPYLAQIHTSYKDEILNSVFNDFIQIHIIPLMKNVNIKIGIVGGIAYHFKRELFENLSLLGIKEIEIVKSPMEGLINYHLNN